MKNTSLIIAIPVIALSVVIALGVLYKMKVLNGSSLTPGSNFMTKYGSEPETVVEEDVPESDLEKELNNTPDFSAETELNAIDADLQAL